MPRAWLLVPVQELAFSLPATSAWQRKPPHMPTVFTCLALEPGALARGLRAPLLSAGRGAHKRPWRSTHVMPPLLGVNCLPRARNILAVFACGCRRYFIVQKPLLLSGRFPPLAITASKPRIVTSRPFSKWRQNLNLGCVLLQHPSVLGGGNTSRIRDEEV